MLGGVADKSIDGQGRDVQRAAREGLGDPLRPRFDLVAVSGMLGGQFVKQLGQRRCASCHSVAGNQATATGSEGSCVDVVRPAVPSGWIRALDWSFEGSHPQ